MKNKSKHTPGPWRRGFSNFGNEHIITAGKSVKVIAIIKQDLPQRENELANAQLIAAAPDMLEALKEALEDQTALLNKMTDIFTNPMVADVYKSKKQALRNRIQRTEAAIQKAQPKQ